MPSPCCHRCGAAITIGEPFPRDAECASCRADLRCCMNCRHYDPALNNACRETEAEPVESKDRRNFCEYFVPSAQAFRGGAAGEARQQDARRKLDALFGGRSAPSPTSAESARARLEGLFKPAPKEKDADG
jgi:hypothetical protein